jgi:hypothetical protein
MRFEVFTVLMIMMLRVVMPYGLECGISENGCMSSPSFYCYVMKHLSITYHDHSVAGQRQIEHNAILLAVYKENPNAQWVLRCHHRNSNNAPPAS